MTPINTATAKTYKAALKPAQDGPPPPQPPPPAERPTDWFQLSVILVGLMCMGAGLGFERSLLPRMAVTTFHHSSVSMLIDDATHVFIVAARILRNEQNTKLIVSPLD